MCRRGHTFFVLLLCNPDRRVRTEYRHDLEQIHILPWIGSPNSRELFILKQRKLSIIISLYFKVFIFKHFGNLNFPSNSWKINLTHLLSFIPRCFTQNPITVSGHNCTILKKYMLQVNLKVNNSKKTNILCLKFLVKCL